MRKLLIVVALMVLLLVGCSEQSTYFDDTEIIFTMLNSNSIDGTNSYSIQIENRSELTVSDLHLYLTYDIKTSNGTKENPFKVEGRTNTSKPVSLKKNESIVFYFTLPIEDIFGDSKLLDFDKSVIKLTGITLRNGEEIPFEIGGNLDVFLNR